MGSGLNRSIALALITILLLSMMGQVSTFVTEVKAQTDVQIITVIIESGAADSASGRSYSPKQITVNAGTTIVWKNADSAVHTVTHDSLFDSGSMRSGDTFEMTFNDVGTFAYHCKFYPWMKGTVIVEEKKDTGKTPIPPESQELSYDDGIVDFAFICDIGCVAAVKFSVPSEVQILKLKYLISPSQIVKFRAHVLDSNFNSIYSRDVALSSTESHWFEVDVSDARINVAKDFFVALQWIEKHPKTGKPEPWLSVDKTSPHHGTSRLGSLGSPGLPPANEDYMIRVVVKEKEMIQTKPPIPSAPPGEILKTAEPTGTSDIRVGNAPIGIDVNPNTNMIYVVNNESNSVSVIDGSTNKVVKSIDVGKNPVGIVVNPDTNMVYVAVFGSNSISVIDGSTNKVVKNIPDPGAAEIDVNPNTNMVYTVLPFSNGVSVIDGSTNTWITTIDVGEGPWDVAVNPNTNMIYAPIHFSDLVAVIDGSTNKVVKTIDVGRQPGHVAVNVKTNMIYAGMYGSKSVYVIDGLTNKVTKTIDVGDVPIGIDVNPNTNMVYVAIPPSDLVSVIDGSTNSVVTTIDVGDAPERVAVNPNTNMIYVANGESNSLSVIDGQSVEGKKTVEERKDASKTPKPPTTGGGQRKVIGKSGIIFAVPDELPDDAVVGKHYSYSFCNPEPASKLLCGGLMHDPSVTNPVGGVQPYTFQKETLLTVGGDIPFGLTLHPNGVLDGTPIKQDAGKTFKFKVCAIDNTRSFVCERTSLKVLESGAAGQIGEPPEIIPGEVYESLTYRILYEDSIETIEHHESYPQGEYIYTIKHESSADVPLQRRGDLADLYSDFLEYPAKATITAKYLGGIGKEFFPTREVECPPVSWSSTVEGTMRVEIVYHEYVDKLFVSLSINFPELAGKVLGWGLCPAEGNLITELDHRLDSLGLVDDKTECFASSSIAPYMLPDFDIYGGTKSESCDRKEGKSLDVNLRGTITASLISAERATVSAPSIEEEPSPLPTTLTGDVRSWTTKDGKKGTICNPTRSPDNPCKEISGPVQEGDTIKTEKDNFTVISFDDGRTQIWLGPDQKMKVLKLSEDERIFLIFDLPYQMRAVINAPQGVKTIFAICSDEALEADDCSTLPILFWLLVTGTEFALEHSGEATRLTALEGEVQVWRPAEQGVIVTASTNQQLVLEVDAPLVPSSIDPASIDRWWIEAEAAQPQQITPPSGGGCLIATAAFGSELTPQVQFLRNFRDERILSTAAGSSFMNVFNTWYYSFSPNVADAERENPVLQQIIKYAIYPLLGILTVAEKAYSIFNGETGAVTAGFITSSMIGFVYFWPIGYAIAKVRRRFSSNVLIYPVFVSLVGVIAGILISDPILLMITTSAFVITVVGISAVLSSKLISKIIRK